MALLFSKVTLTAGGNQVSFLVAGIPKTAYDLIGWVVFEKIH